MKAETVTLTTKDGGSMQAYVAYPQSDGKAPGLMVFQEAFGVNAHIKALCDMFAEKGYVAIAPELYHRSFEAGFFVPYDRIADVADARAAMTYETIGDDVTTTYNWLRECDQVDGDKIASIGYCMGGRVSYFASMTVPVKASVCYYGGGIAQDLSGQADKVGTPLLFFWGGEDKNIPREDRTTILEALDTAGKEYINVEISDAGHGFSCDERPSYHKEGSLHALTLTLSFLESKLA